jgi:hypothetical protein
MVRQAIKTEYKGPTNHRGARVIAKCDAGRLTHSWDHAADIAENHIKAAAMLKKQLGWAGDTKAGSIGSEYYHVFN